MKRSLIIILLFFSYTIACYSQEGYKGFEISVVSDNGAYYLKVFKNKKDVSKKYVIATMTVSLFINKKYVASEILKVENKADSNMIALLKKPIEDTNEYRYEFEAVIISNKNYQKFIKEVDNSLKDPKTIPVLTIVREKYWD